MTTASQRRARSDKVHLACTFQRMVLLDENRGKSKSSPTTRPVYFLKTGKDSFFVCFVYFMVLFP